MAGLKIMKNRRFQNDDGEEYFDDTYSAYPSTYPVSRVGSRGVMLLILIVLMVLLGFYFYNR